MGCLDISCSSGSFCEDLMSLPTQMAVDTGLVPTRQPEVFESASQSLPNQPLPAFQHLGLLRVPLSPPQPHWLLLRLTTGFACAIPLPGTLICFPLAGLFPSGNSYKCHLLKEVFPGCPLKWVHTCSQVVIIPWAFPPSYLLGFIFLLFMCIVETTVTMRHQNSTQAC